MTHTEKVALAMAWYDSGLEDRAAFQKLMESLFVQPEQEPVAIKRMKEWIEYLKRKSDFGQHMKIPSEMSAGTCWELALELEQFINTTPPQRKPLTQDGTMEIANQTAGQYWMDEAHIQRFRAAVEAAHGIKENT